MNQILQKLRSNSNLMFIFDSVTCDVTRPQPMTGCVYMETDPMIGLSTTDVTCNKIASITDQLMLDFCSAQKIKNTNNL